MKNAIVIGASSGIGKELTLVLIITDIKPGFVNTDIAKGEGKFWVATPTKAAVQIYSAIQKQKSHAYITRRWFLIEWILKFMPNWLYDRI